MNNEPRIRARKLSPWYQIASLIGEALTEIAITLQDTTLSKTKIKQLKAKRRKLRVALEAHYMKARQKVAETIRKKRLIKDLKKASERARSEANKIATKTVEVNTLVTWINKIISLVKQFALAVA